MFCFRFTVKLQILRELLENLTKKKNKLQTGELQLSLLLLLLAVDSCCVVVRIFGSVRESKRCGNASKVWVGIHERNIKCSS